MLDTILFDLDGTLIPFFQDDFIRAYFAALVHHMTPLGFDGETLVKAVWRGTNAMVANDGRVTNRQLFWEVFTHDLGIQALSLETHLEDFYLTDFDKVRSILREDADRSDLIRSLRRRGYQVILATTPIFPRVAVETRLAWVGLSGGDFDYITSYENCRHSKPNTAYYTDILDATGIPGENCLMIGNNPIDDMAAMDVGISAWLVTDYIENPQNVPIERYPHGNYARLEQILMALPEIT